MVYIVFVNQSMTITFFEKWTRTQNREDSYRKIIEKLHNHELLNEFRAMSNNHCQTGHKSIVIPNGTRELVK